MFVTIIKDRDSKVVPETDRLLSSQKLVLSSSISRFSPFQYVLVPFSNSNASAICQVVKKPDLHSGFCYVNANVVMRGRFDMDAEEESGTVKSGRFDTDERVQGGTLKSGRFEANNLGVIVDETGENTRGGTENQEDKSIQLPEFQNQHQQMKNQQQQLKNQQQFIDQEANPPQNQNHLPNVFEEFSGSKLDLEHVEELTDQPVQCKNVNVSVVMDKQYKGTREDLNRLVKQILAMYTFTDACFINVHLENIHSILIHDATPYLPPSKPKTSNLSTSNLDLTPTGINTPNRRYMSQKKVDKSAKATPNTEKMLESDGNLSKLTPNNPMQTPVVPGINSNSSTENAVPPSVKTDSTSIHPRNTVPIAETAQQTSAKTGSTSNLPPNTVPSAEIAQPASTTQNRRLFCITPKTKLNVSTTYSPEYYRQLIRFGRDCDGVKDCVRWCDAWRCMRELILCRKRGMGGGGMNSANKILLIGASGSGKTHLMTTLARACHVPLVCVRGNQFSTPSPGVAESSLAETLRSARGLAEENRGLCIVLFEQVEELVPVSSSLSHITRLSLQLTHLLDTSPPSSPLFFVFSTTAAHLISSRLKSHAQIYLTAPGIEFRRSILDKELAPVSLLDDQLGDVNVELGPNEKKVGSVNPKLGSFDTDLGRVNTSSHSVTTKLGPGNAETDPVSMRRAVVDAIVGLTGSYLPVDLVRVANVVMLFLAKHGRRCTTEDIIAHVRSTLAHYRPACLKSGGLGVIDLSADLSVTTGQMSQTQEQTGESYEEIGEKRIEESEGQMYEEGRRERGGFENSEGKVGGGVSKVGHCARSSGGGFGSELGGMTKVRALVEKTVEWPFKYAKQFERLGIPRSKGILLYGPPGCGKTALVRSLGRNSSCRVLAVSAAQLYSPYVGEAEQNVAQLFHRARLSAPAILFIDEIDALVGNRSEASSKDVQQSVLSVFLNEMDGVGVKPEIGSSDPTAGHVLVIAATNRPHMLDAALVRPGRLDKLIYVRPPSEDERVDILVKVGARGSSVGQRNAKSRPADDGAGESPSLDTAEDVDWEYLGRMTDGYSGADLCNLYREAALISLLDKGFDNSRILQSHWLSALTLTRPSLTSAQLQYYEDFERTV